LKIKRASIITIGLLLALTGFFLFLWLGNISESVKHRRHFRRVSSRDFGGDPLTYDAFRRIADRLNPTVVTIYATLRHRASFHDFLGIDPSDGPFSDKTSRRQVLGSGFIADEEGYILTNNHVVDGASGISVSLDGTQLNLYEARLLDRDRRADLALLQIRAGRPLRFATLGDSNSLEVGDWVIAIGNPFNLDHSVTVGIVSAKGRSLGDRYAQYIQTDASINPGNSGGPLLNVQGEVVGINTAIYTRSGQSEGIGFAIPIDRARKILP
jgi:S1-C subfamily serine protease